MWKGNFSPFTHFFHTTVLSSIVRQQLPLNIKMITHLLIALQSQCSTRKCRNKMSVKILTDIIFVPCQEWLSQHPLSQAETECTAVQMCVTSKKIKLHFSRKTDTLVFRTNQFIILSAFCIWTQFHFFLPAGEWWWQLPECSAEYRWANMCPLCFRPHLHLLLTFISEDPIHVKRFQNVLLWSLKPHSEVVKNACDPTSFVV